MCRFFNVSTQKVVSRVSKAVLPGSKSESKPVYLFHDDTLKSFFRRLCFSPCGSIIFAPAGLIEPLEPGQKSVNATLVFTRNSISRPVAYLPSYNQYSVAVRCCPKLFALRAIEGPPLFNLPHRVVFAIATQSSVLLYDTQHYSPFAYIANIHYTRLTDLTWSSDGRILIVSSTDGYCSIITFSENELGEPYTSSETSKNTNLNVNDEGKATPVTDTTEGVGNVLKANEITPVVKSVSDNKVKEELIKNDTEDFVLIMEETVNDSESNSNAKETTNHASNVSEEMELCESGKESNKSETLPSENMEVCEGVLDETNKSVPNLSVTPSKPICTSPASSLIKTNSSPLNITPIEQRKPKRAQLITLSSPKSKKKL